MTPIFILACDRLECLKQSLESYRDCIKTPYEAVIVDFGSTYTPTVEFLRKMEGEGTKVYWGEKIEQAPQLNMASEYIRDYFLSHPLSNYVVTDPDIALDNTPGNILEVYSFLLENMPSIQVVGAMLGIDDIPEHYPLRDKLLDGRMGLHKQFHSRPVSTIVYMESTIRYIHALVDTTFGMYRVGSHWSRLRPGIRVLSPYAARHLDWYIDHNNLTPDQAYYAMNASKLISNWGLVHE